MANINNGRWTNEEHLRFVEALKLYGKDWNKVQEHIATRTAAQARSHAQKYFNKLCKRGNLRDLAIFDALLSSKRKGDGTLNLSDIDVQYPIYKTKSISKNYNTRFFQVGKVNRVSSSKAIY